MRIPCRIGDNYTPARKWSRDGTGIRKAGARGYIVGESRCRTRWWVMLDGLRARIDINKRYIVREDEVSRNLAKYPITQEEVVKELRWMSKSVRDNGGIGDLTPHIFEFVARWVEKMTPEEWAKFSEGLNP
jgi:hypothetical protein